MPNQSFQEACPPEIEDRFIELLQRGNYRSVAARACGLNPHTVDYWIKRGDGRKREAVSPPPADMVRFARRVLEAEAKAEVAVVENVLNAAEKDGNVGLKFLGRRYGSRWGEKTETTVTVNWVVKAVQMLKSGEVTLEALEATLGPQPALEVRKALEAGDTVEGEYSEVSEN